MDRIQDSDLIQAGGTLLFKWRPQLLDLLEDSIKNQKRKRLKEINTSWAKLHCTLFNLTERYYCRFYNLRIYSIDSMVFYMTISKCKNNVIVFLMKR